MFPIEKAKAAASSYTNAREFYLSTTKPKKGEVNAGNFYIGTSATLASSSSSKKYQTVGFDFTLIGNGRSVSFAAKLDDPNDPNDIASITHIDVKEDLAIDTQYNLYCINTNTLIAYAEAQNPSAFAQVKQASQIKVVASAIITTKQRGVPNGGVVETGNGGLSQWGTIFHLGNSTQLNAAKGEFPGHTFYSYYYIDDEIDNYTLSVIYDLGYGVNLAGGYTTGAYVDEPNILYTAYGPYTERYHMMQYFSPLNPSAIGLSKPGHHLESGKEWKTSTGYTFSKNGVYSPKNIEPNVAYGNKGTILRANWQKNYYYIAFDLNGGEGFLPPIKVYYDESKRLPFNGSRRRGYSLVAGAEWNTKPDGTGTSYTSDQVVRNLTTQHGAVVTLYANWTPNTYEIKTDPLQGSGGTPQFYQKYDTAFFSDKETTLKIQGIDIPTRAGYEFLGYLPYIYGVGETIVDGTGKIVAGNNFFAEDSTIYAKYKPKVYTITFDKVEGTGGYDSVKATFDEYLPYAEAPEKTGYSFKGYYSESDYSGEIWYLETMGPNVQYTVPNDITLYAKWVDDIKPYAFLSVSNPEWTKEKVTVTLEASDNGSGLAKVELYCGLDNTPVFVQDTFEDKNAEITATLTHTKEGAYRYRLVATDIDGNVAEAFAHVKYDIKAPSGSYVITDPDLDNFGADVNANDYNIQ